MREDLDRNKIVLGLSGGVDSATAALLLKERGFEVTGLYFDIQKEPSSAWLDASRTANEIGIPVHYVNVNTLFEKKVIQPFIDDYMNGRTPNPCIVCNPDVKFQTLLSFADEIKAYHIATGHYGTTYHDPHTDSYFIKRGTNQKKDQTYMLYRLSQDVISRLILPLDGFDSKDEIRKIASGSGLTSSHAKDSQEICFIDNNSSYEDFLQERKYTDGFQKGPFIDLEGNIIGEHQGIARYTVGQRKGLGQTFGKPMYVVGINSSENAVILGENDTLFQNTVYSSHNFFTLTGKNFLPSCYEGKKLMGKIRYGAKPSPCTVTMEGNLLKTVFEEQQRAVTPGQSIVFYEDDILIGGGFILKA